MSQQAFEMESGNSLIAQPDTDGEKLILVSSSTDDVTGQVTVHGTVSSAYSNETRTMGDNETETLSIYEALAHVRLGSAFVGTLSVYSQGVAAVGSIIVTTNPSDGDTFTLGLDDSETVYTFKGTLTGSSYEVKIGASASDTATNIKKAINDEGTEGTHYGTGTDPHQFVTAQVSGISVTITDRLGVARRNTWVLSQTGTGLSLTAPIGGENGVLLAEIAPGDLSAHPDVTLDNEDLSDANLPAGLAFESEWVRVAGSQVTLNLLATGANDLAWSYKTSTDAGVTARAGQTSGSSIGSGTFHSINPSEQAIEYIQFLITNAGTSDRNVHAKVIYG